MRAITIRQPFASLCVMRKGKDVENRSWKTAYRGACLNPVREGSRRSGAMRCDSRANAHKDPSSAPMQRGVVGKSCKLVDCVEESPSLALA